MTAPRLHNDGVAHKLNLLASDMGVDKGVLRGPRASTIIDVKGRRLCVGDQPRSFKAGSSNYTGTDQCPPRS